MAFPQPPAPVLSLAPMQDVTDHAFWRLMARYGGADVYYTEYFRVHPSYRLEKSILRSIDENPTGKPAIAQLIGNDIPALVRTAKELLRHPVAGIDLNLGCPAPVVYRKRAGGGLLRELALVDSILEALREAVDGSFSVKTRVGFEDWDRYDALLEIFDRRRIDALVVHGRTVKEMYSGEPHYDLIARAARVLSCPVSANGNIYSVDRAREVFATTGVAGLMIGRGAIRNPWIFPQIRASYAGEPEPTPTGRDVLRYVEALYEEVTDLRRTPDERAARLKRHMNYLGAGVDVEGAFLHRIRRSRSQEAFFQVCRDFLDHDRPMSLVPCSVEAPESQRNVPREFKARAVA